MASTEIEWTDATWNPVRGCARVSPGCEHCYAERVAHRFSGPGQPYEGLTVVGKQGPRWAGRARFVPEKLGEPLRWKKPRRIFVNSMSDLFHADVTNEQIAAVFGVMAAAPQHTFQLLTKRPECALEWFRWVEQQNEHGQGPDFTVQQRAWELLGSRFPLHPIKGTIKAWPWPLTNVWLGASCEDQQRAAERVPVLLQCPAIIRFLSLEPLLGPIDLTHIDAEFAGHPDYFVVDALTGRHRDMGRPCADVPRVNWVIIGGESGPGARPSDIAWHRSIIEQCRAAGVAVFEKQLGALPTQYSSANECLLDHVAHVRFLLRDRKGGHMADWPEDLRVRQFPNAQHWKAKEPAP